ncbi:MAG: hypothetical protein IJL87_04010 [Clostridia bacterium]|nr:hypothetical protein [Clostridia bacterium]
MDNDIYKSIGSAAGVDQKTVEQLKHNPKVDNLLGRLSQQDKEKLLATLSDKEATKKLLQSPQAQKILAMLKGGGQNG